MTIRKAALSILIAAAALSPAFAAVDWSTATTQEDKVQVKGEQIELVVEANEPCRVQVFAGEEGEPLTRVVLSGPQGGSGSTMFRTLSPDLTVRVERAGQCTYTLANP